MTTHQAQPCPLCPDEPAVFLPCFFVGISWVSMIGLPGFFVGIFVGKQPCLDGDHG